MRRATDSQDKKPPKPVTAEWLFRAAADYLGRYASSTERLRQVLARKVQRRAQLRGEDASAFSGLVDETVARFIELGLLDDRAFAETKLASLRRRGTSKRQSAMKLAEKGVDRETVAAVLEADETDEEGAARALAKRRRLGPHRLTGRAERRERDVAAMMRAGFSYSLAAGVIDGDADPE